MRKRDEQLMDENAAAKNADDQIIGDYVAGMDSGNRVELTADQLAAHVQECARIEDTRNELIDRGYHWDGNAWVV